MDILKKKPYFGEPRIMNFRGVQKFVIDLLDKELPLNLFYHGVHHTFDVCNAVEELSREENIFGTDLELLRTAAVMHDIGFIEQYLHNEPVAAKFAHSILPSFEYSFEQIHIIADIIMCTQIPQTPKNHVEQIMCDADLDYLGRNDFFTISETLKREWFANRIISSEEEYNRKQISFFEQHKYYTKSAQRKRDALKQLHLLKLKSSLDGSIVEVSNTNL